MSVRECFLLGHAHITRLVVFVCPRWCGVACIGARTLREVAVMRLSIALGGLATSAVVAATLTIWPSSADAGCKNTAQSCSSALSQCQRLNAVEGPSGPKRCVPVYKRCMKDGTWIGRTCNRTGLQKA